MSWRRFLLRKGTLDFLFFGAFLVVTCAMFGDVLLTNKSVVMSHKSGDMFAQFIHWRNFGFSEMRKGNFPLWNPYIYSGAPFFGGFQSALLYPPNFIFLFLPLAKAINLSMIIHIILLALFVYLWAKYRGLHPLACLLVTTLSVFGSTFFLRLYAGHLSNLCSMTWAPIVFLMASHLFERVNAKWILIGIFAVSMQILAGHPQYVFYTAVALCPYWLFQAIKARRGLRVASALLLIYGAASLICSVQLLPGLDAAAEGARGEKVPYAFAADFSLAPKQLLTLLSPLFFGDTRFGPYWGSGNIWEMTFYFGVVGLFLAVYGAIYGDGRLRRVSVPMIIIMLILALGGYTPFFSILYRWVPGFSTFRGTAKFTFFVSLFATALAGVGYHAMLNFEFRRRRPIVAILIFLFVAGIVTALTIRESASSLAGGAWGRMLRVYYEIAEDTPEARQAEAHFIFDAGRVASRSVFVTSCICLVLGILIALTKFSRKAVYAIGGLAAVEILSFAITFRTVNPIEYFPQPQVADFLKRDQGDYRTLIRFKPNSAMSLRVRNLSGDDTPVYRYAEFIYRTLGFLPEAAAVDSTFDMFPTDECPKLYAMLRCKYIFNTDGSLQCALGEEDILSRVQLISDWRLIQDRDAIFAAMEEKSFDPRKTVILEHRPVPEPEPCDDPGTVRVVEYGTDYTIVEAKIKRPTILLKTGLYCSGWHAWGLEGSPQKEYQILPANYILRAIPLGPGEHHIKIEYLPFSFLVGKWLSIISFLIYLVVCGWMYIRTRKAPSQSVLREPKPAQETQTPTPEKVIHPPRRRRQRAGSS